MNVKYLITFFDDMDRIYDEYFVFAKNRVQLNKLIVYHLEKYHNGMSMRYTVQVYND